MALTHKRLDKMHDFVKRMIRDNGVRAKVTATTDRREALTGRGLRRRHDPGRRRGRLQIDYEIPLKYGVDQCIGDTLGPGGIFRGPAAHPGAARHRPRHAGARAPARCCSTTPTPWRCAAGRWGKVPGLQFVGLCHGVQTTLDLIAGYVGVPKEEIDFLAAGINHMAWFLKLEKDGQGPVPDPQGQLREARVLRQREGARRGHAPLRLLHDREHRPPLRVPAVVPQEREGPGRSTATSRPSAARRAPTTSTATHAGREVPDDGPAVDRVDEARARAAPSTARTSSRRWRRASPSGSTATSATTATSPTCPHGCCVEVPIFVDRHGPAPDGGRRPAAAVRGAQHDQRARAGARRGGGLHGRPRAGRAGRRPRPADLGGAARWRRSAR